MIANYIILLLIIINQIFAEVTILKRADTIYDRSPKLRIRGSGFDVDEHSIILELSASGQPTLVLDKDFLITKDDDGIILKLLSNRKWVDLTGRTPPVALILSTVKFATQPEKILLAEPVIVAQVLPTPTVQSNSDIIYSTATNELRISGTGFVGAEKVDIYFSPPLYVGVGYEIVSKFPLSVNTLVLRIRHGYKWREEPGPLKVIGVDSGAGNVKLNGDEGVLVAEVQADLDLHGITVEATAPTQYIYHDDPNIIIIGTGFNILGNTLRFANGILGKGVNYTTASITPTSLSLRLTAGSSWRKDVDNLPGTLTLLAVNAGEGFVAVGPKNAGKGRDIATVFERSQIFSQNTKIYRTHSHELHIRGTGFPMIISKPKLVFSPPLIEGVDYVIKVLDRSEIEVTLLDGRAWRSSPGTLYVESINTRGDEAGWVKFPSPEAVADVIEDIDADLTDGVEIYPMGVKVYQSALQKQIVLTGNGFKNDMSLLFEPDLSIGVDFDLEVRSKSNAILKLRNNKKWRNLTGLLNIKAIKTGGKFFNLAGNDGITVANVLADPLLFLSTEKIQSTKSKVIIIKGSGFTNAVDMKIHISPTLPGAYKIVEVSNEAVKIELKYGESWLPSLINFADESSEIPLKVTGIDTGAGEIIYDDPIIIGYVIKDISPVIFTNPLMIYSAAPTELQISGTGFTGAKKADILFSPPLNAAGYEILSSFPLLENIIILHLRYGYKWRDEPGSLKVISIDFGDGPIKVNGDEGIVVALVQADLNLQGVTVKNTAVNQYIYNDDSYLTITGTGFNILGNRLRFTNDILGNGINYTTVSVTPTQISLRLTAGSSWRKTVDNLPAVLTLLSIDNGEGFISVEPTSLNKGKDVATVFERPQIVSQYTKIYLTYSKELYIRGKGFIRSDLQFSPPLTEGVDYISKVIDKSEIQLKLLDGKAWRPSPGILYVECINTRGDVSGIIRFPTPIAVAEVIEDIDVFTSDAKIYQSKFQDQIVLNGKGFRNDMNVIFESSIIIGVDVDLHVINNNKAILKLRNNKKWRYSPGNLVLKAVVIDSKSYYLGGNNGIKVAEILSDPFITMSTKDRIRESQTEVVSINGHGFTNILDMKLFLRPTSPNSYEIKSVEEDTIIIHLKQDYTWIPSDMSLKGTSDIYVLLNFRHTNERFTIEAELLISFLYYIQIGSSDASSKIPLQVTGINTGAGEIIYDLPITIGYIIKDQEEIVDSTVLKKTTVDHTNDNHSHKLLLVGMLCFIFGILVSLMGLYIVSIFYDYKYELVQSNPDSTNNSRFKFINFLSIQKDSILSNIQFKYHKSNDLSDQTSL